MPELLPLLARFAAATLLLYAGARKLAEPRDFRATLTALAVPGKGVPAFAVPLSEIATAMMPAALPWPAITALLVGVLGLSFAGAGVVMALIGGKNIRRACLGRSSRPLGVRQLVHLPLWEWPIAHVVHHGVTRDQFMARHKANHVQIAHAPDAATADKALLAKAAFFHHLGVEVHVCGDVNIQAPAGRGSGRREGGAADEGRDEGLDDTHDQRFQEHHGRLRDHRGQKFRHRLPHMTKSIVREIIHHKCCYKDTIVVSIG
ncbi:MAG TPA: MauE/DoxX family redox-associated membrane protein [Nonomuraea sp.]|nr:MauE/DoxX family redox-associated membrane protein [Nonomuraea sp.]